MSVFAWWLVAGVFKCRSERDLDIRNVAEGQSVSGQTFAAPGSCPKSDGEALTPAVDAAEDRERALMELNFLVPTC